MLDTHAVDSKPTLGASLDGAGRKVLIIDDNVDSAEMLGVILTMLGFLVETRHDGPSAIELANIFRPEVVLLDIGLPGMDGYTVAHQLRLQPSFHDTLIVNVSGDGDRVAREYPRSTQILANR